MPVIESLARDFDGRARFVVVHLDRAGKAAAAFRSRGLPDYIVFRDGVEVGRLRLPAVSWLLEWRLRAMLSRALH